MEKLDRVTIDPKICQGQPTLRGTRITGSVVLKMLAGGKSVPDVLTAYPELEVEDVQQAMRYAAWVVSDQILARSACPMEVAPVRFLADVNLSPLTVTAPAKDGMDIARVSDVLPANASDETILDLARREERVVITQDMDFSALLALGGRAAAVNASSSDPAWTGSDCDGIDHGFFECAIATSKHELVTSGAR